MDANNLIGVVMTVVSFLFFVGIVWWAYGGSRRARFEADARIPFEGIDDLPTGDKK